MKSIQSRVLRRRAGFLAAIASVAAALSAQAHAFLDHAEPGVGSSAKQLPKEVKVTFTEEVEPAFSSLKVFDAAGKQVDSKNVHVDPKDGKILIVSLPGALGVGTYKVVWRVVSKDTHITQGDFTIAREP